MTENIYLGYAKMEEEGTVALISYRQRYTRDRNYSSGIGKKGEEDKVGVWRSTLIAT